jgi:hypothetical protein
MFLDSLFASGAPSFFVLLWKGFAPPKIDVFIWLLLNGSTLSNRVFLAGGGGLLIMRMLFFLFIVRRLDW